VIKKLFAVAAIMLTSTVAQAETLLRVAVQPTFAAHQAIGYEILRVLPAHAEKRGISDLKIETTPSKSSITGNSLLLNKQIDINVGSVTSFMIMHSKAPDSARLLSAVGHYKFMLLCIVF